MLGMQGKTSTSSTEHTKTRTTGQTAENLYTLAGIHIDLYCLGLYKPIDVKIKDAVLCYII